MMAYRPRKFPRRCVALAPGCLILSWKLALALRRSSSVNKRVSPEACELAKFRFCRLRFFHSNLFNKGINIGACCALC